MEVPFRHRSFWQLSLSYFSYFALLGAFVPYWGLYLNESGYSASEIGELYALLLATKIIAPSFWGWLAQMRWRRIELLRYGSFFSIFCFLPLIWFDSYWWVFVCILGFSFFWNATLPLLEAITLTRLASHHERYAQIRLWGSIGFIISVAILGVVFQSISIHYLPLLICLLLLLIFISTLLVIDAEKNEHDETHLPLQQLLADKSVKLLLWLCLLMQLAHGAYYSFFSMYAQNHGYDHFQIGLLWSLGVIAEVLAFYYMPRLITRYGLHRLLLFSFICAIVRWLLLALVIDSVILTTFSQLLHACTFGIYHVVAISYIHYYFIGRNQEMGQALYSSVSFGMGGAIGSLAAGYLWDISNPMIMFVFSSIISLIALVLSLRHGDFIRVSAQYTRDS